MKWSYKILTVRGIDIRFHITFPLIILYALYVGSQSFARPWQGALFGALSMGLLFVCVVLHELAHSLQAIALGIQVRDITLLPIGGISLLAASPEDPKDELRIAISGPALSLGLATLLFGGLLVGLRLGWIASLPHLLRSLETPSWIGLLVYLMAANLILGLFNLIPAFPMDGGRVLRSLLSLWLGPARAVQVASIIGRILAVAMGIAGIFIGNIMLILVALFVYTGASLENRMFSIQKQLEGMTVADILVPVETVLPENLSLGAALEIAQHSRQPDFPIAGESTWIGVLSASNLAKAAEKHALETGIAALAVRDFPVFSPFTDLFAVYTAVRESPAQAAAIRHGSDFIGLIGKDDLNRALKLRAAPHRRQGQ